MTDLRVGAFAFLSVIGGGLLGTAGAWALFHSRIDQLDTDVEKLDARSAAVARLDPERVRRCLQLSVSWQDTLNRGEFKQSEAYGATMNDWNCAEVMDAIRHVR